MFTIQWSSRLSNTLQANLSTANARFNRAVTALSSGKRINSASDDVASLSIATNLESKNITLTTRARTIARNISTLNIAYNTANSIQNILIEIKTTTVQAAADGLSAADRQGLQNHVDELLKEVDRLAKLNGLGRQSLLTGERVYISYDGTADDAGYITAGDLRTNSLLSGGINLSSAENASMSQAYIKEALNTVQSSIAVIGAHTSKLEYTSQSLEGELRQVGVSISELVDADIAEFSTELAVSKVLQEASISLLAQANTIPGELVNKLIEEGT